MDGPGERQCAARSYRYQGKYKDQTIDGSVRLDPVGQYCKAVLVARSALGAWLAKGDSTASFHLHGQGNRMSLVTPLGLFPVALEHLSINMSISGAPEVLALTEEAPN